MKNSIIQNCLQKKWPYFFLFTILLTSIYTQAQVVRSKGKENADVHGFATTTFDMANPDKKIGLSNFSNLTVLDERPDTGRIGLEKKRRGKYLFKDEYSRKVIEESTIYGRPAFVLIQGGLQNKLEKYARQCFEFSKTGTITEILMLVKKLWIADEPSGDLAKRNPYKSFDSSRNNYPNLYLTICIEFYLKKDNGYYALYKYDTVNAIKANVFSDAEEFISDAVNSAMARLPEMDSKIDFILKKRGFSLDQIKEHAEEPYRVAIMTDTVLKTGVYMSFDEFRNNSPSEKRYRVKKEKLSDNIYIPLPGGEEQNAKNAWGYCDGKYIYIRSANNFYILQRLGNAFYVFGSNELVNKDELYSNDYSSAGAAGMQGVGGGNTRFPGNFMPLLKAFFLDWETGVLY
jgi:hypothetical protein